MHLNAMIGLMRPCQMCMRGARRSLAEVVNNYTMHASVFSVGSSVVTKCLPAMSGSADVAIASSDGDDVDLDQREEQARSDSESWPWALSWRFFPDDRVDRATVSANLHVVSQRWMCLKIGVTESPLWRMTGRSMRPSAQPSVICHMQDGWHTMYVLAMGSRAMMYRYKIEFIALAKMLQQTNVLNAQCTNERRGGDGVSLDADVLFCSACVT